MIEVWVISMMIESRFKDLKPSLGPRLLNSDELNIYILYGILNEYFKDFKIDFIYIFKCRIIRHESAIIQQTSFCAVNECKGQIRFTVECLYDKTTDVEQFNEKSSDKLYENCIKIWVLYVKVY